MPKKDSFSKKEIMEEIDKFQKELNDNEKSTDYDSLILVIMSHGTREDNVDYIYDRKNEKIKVNRIDKLFCNLQ